jgi:hypothetical protein
MLSAVITSAQSLRPKSIIKANRATYITSETKYDRMEVVNRSNIYHTKTPKVSGEFIAFDFTNKSSLLKAFNQVFSDERIKELLPEKGMFVTFYINPQGKILEVSFMVSKATLVTSTELEKLENAIKANVLFKIRQDSVKDADFFRVSLNVKYERVLNRTL